MYFDNLYEELLIGPLDRSDLNKLLIVSGYATSAMSFHYLDHLKKLTRNIRIELIVGMTSRDGLTLSNHRGFKKLVTDEFRDCFTCSYMMGRPPVHSKIYIWCKNNLPVLSFTGSANYTQTALLLNSQRENMIECDPDESAVYFHSLSKETIFCSHPEAEQRITIYRDIPRRKEYEKGVTEDAEFEIDDLSGLPSVTVSLLGNDDELPARSGLNWGQRPEEHREPNQAYIRLTSEIHKTDFFPPKKVHFTILTDDGKTLVCTRAQENGKAIHTPHNNSLIGEYFRNRLGVGFGKPVLTEDLMRYGRTDVTFYKVDDETYYMDFSA
jgi:hypothetical protein